MIKAKVQIGKPVKFYVKSSYIEDNMELLRECYLLIYSSLKVIGKVDNGMAKSKDYKVMLNDLEEMLDINKVVERNKIK